MQCAITWDDPEELKMVCKYTGEHFVSVMLELMAYNMTRVAGAAIKQAEYQDLLPEGFIVKVIATNKLETMSLMSKTSTDTLLKMIAGKITTQVEWEQEAEIIK